LIGYLRDDLVDALPPFTRIVPANVLHRGAGYGVQGIGGEVGPSVVIVAVRISTSLTASTASSSE
jgi:hypothetical protein